MNATITRRLYTFALSTNAHKTRILLNALGLAYEPISVDIPAGAHQKPAFLAINPRGQVPVLVDGATTIADSHAILVYLAQRYGAGEWLPADPSAAAAVVRWICVAANELQNTVHRARLHFLLGVPLELAATQAAARDVLEWLDTHLRERSWLVGEAPTLADIACAPMVAVSDDAKIDTSDLPALKAWLDRFAALPFYVPLV